MSRRSARRAAAGWRSRLVVALWVAAVWFSLWGELRWGNLVGSLVVGTVLVIVVPVPAATGDLAHHTVRPLAVLLWAGHLAVALVEATIDVAVQVLRPGRAHLREAIVAVPIAGVSDRLVALVANQVTLTPGTLVVDYDTARRVLYVHTLVLRDVGALRAGVRRFEELSVRAFAAADARALAQERWRAIDEGVPWTR